MLKSFDDAISTLQNNHRLHPTNQQFNLNEWEGLFDTRDLRLRHLASFGKRLFVEMQHVRMLLRELDPKFPKNSHRGHQCLAFANAFLDAVEEQQQGLPRSRFLADFVAAEELRGIKMNLRPTMGALVEAVFDSVRLPIVYYDDDSNSGSGRKVRFLSGTLEEARMSNELAAFYNNFEYLWSLVVWRNWVPTEHAEGFVLAPENREEATKIAISQHLNEVAKVQAVPELLPEWLRIPAQIRLTLVPPAARVRLDGASLKISWDWKSRNVDWPSSDVLDQHLLEYRGIDAVVDLATCAHEVSVRDALRFRSLLRQVGFGIQKVYRAGHASERRRTISATISKGELCRATREVTGWGVAKTISCIDLFTLKSPRSEVWYQPLVDLGDGLLGFALHPLCHAVAMRTAEWLLSNDQRREGQKGGAFEQQVLESFEAALARNHVVKAEVRRGLRTTNSVGDIDLFLRFGSIACVIECKCAVYPACGNDFYNREKIIKKASAQAIRKAEFVLKEWHSFSKRHGVIDGTTPKIFLPLVLVSGNEFVGTRVSDDVAVVSRESMAGVLGNYSPTISRVGRDGAEYVRKPAKMYKDNADAQLALLECIKSPPIIEFYRPFMRDEVAMYWSVIDKRAAFRVEFPDVVFDEQAQRDYLIREFGSDYEDILEKNGIG